MEIFNGRWLNHFSEIMVFNTDILGLGGHGGPFSIANFWAPMLSSHTVDMLETPFNLKFIHSLSSMNNQKVKTSDIILCNRDMYSSSRVDKVISDSSLRLQKIGIFPEFRSIPVLLFTIIGLL